MKITQFALLILLSFQINAQIPDSLNVDLPWETVRTVDCEGSMGEGPKTENENVYIQLKSDVVELGELDNCLSRTRTWDIIDWSGSQIYSFEQSRLPNFGAPLICQEDILITYDQLPYTLNKDNVVLNQGVNDEYSFSYDDVNDTELVIETVQETNFEYYMYEHNLRKVCKLNVYLTPCEEDVVFDFPETADIEFNKEPYIELTPEMLGVEIVYPCGTYTIEIEVPNSNSNLLLSNSVGRVVPVRVDVTFSDGNKYVKIIQVNVGGLKPDPYPMFIEDKSFVAGETIALEVWSEEILDLVAWQLQLEFANTEVLSVEESDLFKSVPYNILEDGNVTRALWYPTDGLSVDAESDATWFTLIVQPDFDGSTIDIFETDLDPWSLIAVEDQDLIIQYEAEFVFTIAPRNVLSIEEEIDLSAMEIFPSPTSDVINIKGIPYSSSLTNFEVLNMEGKSMLKEEFNDHKLIFTLDISRLPTGMYVLKTQNGVALESRKIFKQ